MSLPVKPRVSGPSSCCISSKSQASILNRKAVFGINRFSPIGHFTFRLNSASISESAAVVALCMFLITADDVA